MKVKALYDKAAIKIIKEEKSEKGNFLIPQNATAKMIKAEVLSVGQGTERVKPQFKVGDTILFESGSEVEFSKDIVFVHMEKVFAIK